MRGTGKAKMCGALALKSTAKQRYCIARSSDGIAKKNGARARFGGDKRGLGKARVRLVSALHSSVTSGGATALSSKAMEWQSIGMDMYSLGIARH